ncbi:MAG: hypothetical protein ACLGHY_04895, partial [Gammaproteobacteria bacterium]
MTSTGNSEADARLERLLGGHELAALRQRLRRYFERLTDREEAGERREAGEAGEHASLQLTQLSPAEHEAVALLMGRRSRPARSAR